VVSVISIDKLSVHTKPVIREYKPNDTFFVQSDNAKKDSFEMSKINQPVLFMASDKQMYNLKEIMFSRLDAMFSGLEKISLNDNKIKRNLFQKTINWCKNTFCIGAALHKINNDLEKAYMKINSDQPINEIFYELTGMEYTRQNIEKFIKGEIKLKQENLYEEYTGEKPEITGSVLFLDSNWKNINGTEIITDKDTVLSKKEQVKFDEISKNLAPEYQEKLNKILQSGKLKNSKSNDKSSVLDNLYKILTVPRAKGLDNIVLLKECLDILDNPYVITQETEDIPEEYREKVIDIAINNATVGKFKGKNVRKRIGDFLDNLSLGTCAAASLEYDLATNQTAEFFRIVEGLTSNKQEVERKVNMNLIAENTKDAEKLLEKYNISYKKNDDKTITVKIHPDNNAIVRARIQNNYRDDGERSVIDVLMQSTIMNIASGQTYNSLLDTHSGEGYTIDDSGLYDTEVKFVKQLFSENNITLSVYQNYDKDGKLTEQTYEDFIKSELVDELNRGKNILASFVYLDNENCCTNMHEVTIIGYLKNLNNELCFVYQDSANEFDLPCVITAKQLLKQIVDAIY